MTESDVRSALKGINGVQNVKLSAFSDIYTLTFRGDAKLDDKTIKEVFKGCAYNGRKVVIEKDRRAVADFIGVRPLPASPEENPTTSGKVALGKKLFFDTRLSGHGKMSCATCHQPERGFAFTDNIAPAGFNGQRSPRNVPSIINVGYRKSLFLDGRAKTLEEQALGPIQHPAEMGSKLDELVDRLAGVAQYDEAFKREFGGPVTADRIAKALAAYERTIVSNDTPFDRYVRSDEKALSASAKRGFVLFRDKANCITCHSGPDFTDGAFRRIGTGWDGKKYKDHGRGKVTERAGDNGKFRVPPLRELVWTAPYMHDGSFKTLEDVIDFYDRNGTKGAPTDLHGELKLTKQEKKDLVEFLKSLSSRKNQLVRVSTR